MGSVISLPLASSEGLNQGGCGLLIWLPLLYKLLGPGGTDWAAELEWYDSEGPGFSHKGPGRFRTRRQTCSVIPGIPKGGTCSSYIRNRGGHVCRRGLAVFRVSWPRSGDDHHGKFDQTCLATRGLGRDFRMLEPLRDVTRPPSPPMWRNTSHLTDCAIGRGSRELGHTSIMHGVMHLYRGDAHRHGLGSYTEFGCSNASSRYYRRPGETSLPLPSLDITNKPVPVPRHAIQSTGNLVLATAGSQGASRGQPIGELLLVSDSPCPVCHSVNVAASTLSLPTSIVPTRLCERGDRAASCSHSRGNKESKNKSLKGKQSL